MALIRATHLEQWSATRDARDFLGEIIRRLIHAGIRLSNINQVHFLSNEANQLSGWDGILECDSEIPWIPGGRSLWELGTGNRQGGRSGKIVSDFTKRLDKDLPFGWERERTTYVSVTLRKIDDLATLETSLNEDNAWKSVKIVDSTVLEEWIEKFIAVETWLQETGVGLPQSIKSLNSVWREWAEVTLPSITPKLVLVDRESEEHALTRVIQEKDVIYKIKADSPREAIGFIYASLRNMDQEIAQNILNKTIVINKNEDCQRLNGLNQHNVVLLPPATSKAAIVSREGHNVISAFGNSTLAKNIDITLKRPNLSHFAEALIDLGLTKESAEVEARACGASPSIWRVWNQLEISDPSDDIPLWTHDDYLEIVVPAVLMGGWNEKHEGDKNVISKLTKREYGDYRDRLQELLHQDDPLLVKLEDTWIVSAPPTAFALIINKITQTNIELLDVVLKEVFSELDPTIDLPPNERPYAALHGHEMNHSTWLRDGLAQTLLHISVIGERLGENGCIPGSLTSQQYVDNKVSTLLGLKNDWRLVLSLRDQLPVLAEASPFPFLDALNRLLQGNSKNVELLFSEGDDVFGPAYLPYVLWSLEVLAWDKSLLQRVSRILANLADIDPGGKLGNRPISSLRHIFMPWYPCTNAKLEERIVVLESLLKQYPEVGWKLIISVLPRKHQSTSGTSEPKWKDFGRSSSVVLTRKDIFEAYGKYFETALKYVGGSVDRWVKILDYYPDLNQQDKRQIVSGLHELLNQNISASNKQRVWNNLRDMVNHHKSHPSAAWVMDDSDIEELDRLLDLYKPSNYIEKYKWLFESYLPNISLPRNNKVSVQNEINKQREEAIQIINQESGVEGLIELIKQANYPQSIANEVNQLHSIDMSFELVDRTIIGNASEEIFARYLSVVSFNRYGDQWTDLLVRQKQDGNWNEEKLVSSLLNYPDTCDTYDTVKRLGKHAENLYWNKKSIWIGDEDPEAYTYAVSKFIEVDRASEVVNILDRNYRILGHDKVYDILEKMLFEINDRKEIPDNQSLIYWLQKAFTWLRETNEVNLDKLARLEYAYLPLLTHSGGIINLAIYDLFCIDPEYFVDIISDLYMPETSTTNRKQSVDENKNKNKNKNKKAELAYEILNSWKIPPGRREGNDLDISYIRNWVKKAYEKAVSKDRLKMTQFHIGKILYYYPEDPDDKEWPHKQIRDLIEDLNSEEVERGIEIEQFNSRGVVTKAYLEGGKQERDLAEKWGNRSKKYESIWPRTSALCRKISEHWTQDARREDLNVEKEKLRNR